MESWISLCDVRESHFSGLTRQVGQRVVGGFGGSTSSFSKGGVIFAILQEGVMFSILQKKLQIVSCGTHVHGRMIFGALLSVWRSPCRTNVSESLFNKKKRCLVAYTRVKVKFWRRECQTTVHACELVHVSFLRCYIEHTGSFSHLSLLIGFNPLVHNLSRFLTQLLGLLPCIHNGVLGFERLGAEGVPGQNKKRVPKLVLGFASGCVVIGRTVGIILCIGGRDN